MHSIDQNVHVPFRYPVHFTAGVFRPSNALLRDTIAGAADVAPARSVVVLDSGVLDAQPSLRHDVEGYFRHHHSAIALAAPVLVLPGGEQVKNDPRHVDAVHRVIHDAGLCRHSYVIAVGGGAVLDVAGYAAATAHRGMRLVRVPTTVLAQDDSGVGVKNGVNAYGKKNYFGTFAPPFAVINDSEFLRTLADRDWLAGVSEAVKVALVKDAAFFDLLERSAELLVRRDLAAMEQVIRRSAALHLSHIATGGDPFELGSARPLDFGHWAAHRLEHLTSYRLRHGEAVAIGMALDVTYSRLCGHLAEPAWRRILDLLTSLNLPVYAPELEQYLAEDDHPLGVLRGLAEFQEHLGGRLTIMLLHAIGHGFDVHDVRPEVVRRSIEELKQLHKGRADAAARKAS